MQQMWLMSVITPAFSEYFVRTYVIWNAGLVLVVQNDFVSYEEAIVLHRNLLSQSPAEELEFKTYLDTLTQQQAHVALTAERLQRVYNVSCPLN
ncbi:hypothetical protein Dda_3192 [Drechslerella dactyloides]|uniref:Uncharacterized protein n=1 Tax=Drechslerella dactyloides TaxID=74499 RepID=A0AAD6J2G3_DREDA|nr:hypothetical protein Dda_3192 [Drechslerella dactyloides]